MKESCNIMFLKPEGIKEKKNFDFFYRAVFFTSLNKIKKEVEEENIIVVQNKFLENLEKGKEILLELYKIKKEKNCLIAIEGSKSYHKNKYYLELKKEGNSLVDIFFPFLYEEKDAMHHCNSGLNHVLLNIMNERIIAIGLKLDEIINAIKNKDTQYIARLMQNIKFARKKKVNFCLFSFAKTKRHVYDALDTFHFLLALGFDTWQAKSALTFARNKLELNKEVFLHKKGKEFIYKKEEEIRLVDLLSKLNALN